MQGIKLFRLLIGITDRSCSSWSIKINQKEQCTSFRDVI